jgi:uncharacterized membrane protein YGL010W
MKTFSEQLSKYALYHRDARNILTHLVGIPLIVLAVLTLLSRPAVDLGGLMVTPALIVLILSCLYYIRLHVFYGLVMTFLLLAGLQLSMLIASLSTAAWLGLGIGLFVVGWIIQFIGHAYEGKKPAFVDDIIGLVIGPLFIVVEVAFMLGLSEELKQQIELQAGAIRH